MTVGGLPAKLSEHYVGPNGAKTLPATSPRCQHPILAHRLQQRTSDQSSGHHSRSRNQRRTCWHEVMNYRREAGSTRKAQEGYRKSKQMASPEATGAGTATLFITKLPKHRKTIGSREPPSGASNFLDVPFPSTTLASRAITFKWFLITPTLPREEVVTVREPYNRAQPPFHFFLLIGFCYFLPSFLSPFRVCPGLGTFGIVHERLGLSLRSPRSPILHRAAVGVIVPTSFSPSCHCRCSRVSTAHHVQPSHPTLLPLPRLFSSNIEARYHPGARSVQRLQWELIGSPANRRFDWTRPPALRARVALIYLSVIQNTWRAGVEYWPNANQTGSICLFNSVILCNYSREHCEDFICTFTHSFVRIPDRRARGLSVEPVKSVYCYQEMSKSNTRGFGSRRESTITVYPVPLDPGDSTALELRVVNSKWRLLLTCVRRASPGKWTLPSRVA
ncbi:hypothetical protein CRG98_019524 [Punica granatum]|uniref:Uncharacterized protein n=1 Tax=Punica granatum TaxID=22663 RepID=A0A2I0JUT8_PUNGR|nr:hypothetical protein CRG98_019524 [Punica granatum]